MTRSAGSARSSRRKLNRTLTQPGQELADPAIELAYAAYHPESHGRRLGIEQLGEGIAAGQVAHRLRDPGLIGRRARHKRLRLRRIEQLIHLRQPVVYILGAERHGVAGIGGERDGSLGRGLDQGRAYQLVDVDVLDGRGGHDSSAFATLAIMRRRAAASSEVNVTAAR
jgi:hypothetical protein